MTTMSCLSGCHYFVWRCVSAALDNMEKVFECLRQHGLQLKSSKCLFVLVTLLARTCQVRGLPEQ